MLLVIIGILIGGIWHYETYSVTPLLTASSNSSQSASTLKFSASISKGQTLQHDIGNGLVFQLTPNDSGWDIDIFPNSGHSMNDYSLTHIATPPFHGINPIQVEGWHFRNASNTAPNDGSVGAPQEKRDFQFVMNEKDAQIVADAIQQYENGETTDFSPAVQLGHGELTIQNLKLGNLISGAQAWIESLHFSVNLQFPHN